MVQGGNRKRAVILVGSFGALLIAVAIALNIGWIVVSWRTGLLLFAGVVSFAILIAGLALNVGFLIRELRRGERHDDFINAVTHELKTPVASIKLYLQTLRQRDLGGDQRREFIDVMLDDAQRLQSTIDQVLLAGKLGATRRVFEPFDVDVPEMVQECVKLAGKRQQLVNGELRFVDRVADDDDAVVIGDSDELSVAVTNLIENAIKYSGQRIDVAVEVVKLGARRVAIQVKDQGIGIGRDELKHVFRRFYRLPGVLGSRVRGTGLGLSIVRAVARRHGGRAYVESAGAGQGSTFTLELPLKSS